MIKRWPLHPKPRPYELLYNWTETLAEIYGVSHRSFCRNVLELEPEEISSLRSLLPEKAITILANGTGIPVNDLSVRYLGGIFEQLKQEVKKEIEKNPDAFAALLKPWNN